MITKTNEEKIKTFDEMTFNHFSFLFILLIAYFFSDQLYTLITLYFPEQLTTITGIFGVFREAIIRSTLILLIVRGISTAFGEFNINHRPKWYVWLSASLILNHPIFFNQTQSGIGISFEISRIIKSGNFTIFFFQQIIYLAATFGVVQILFLQFKENETPFRKNLRLVISDLLPVIALFFTIIALIQTLFANQFDIIDYSFPIKMMIFLLFTYATLPNIEFEDEINIIDEADTEMKSTFGKGTDKIN